MIDHSRKLMVELGEWGHLSSLFLTENHSSLGGRFRNFNGRVACGRSSLVVRVTSSWPMCDEFELRDTEDPPYIEPDDETDKEFSGESSSIDSYNPQPSSDKGAYISQRIVLMSRNMDNQINTSHCKE
ncbi:hypothetical protein TNCV_3940961 [Trichonephila clavipes]|uniref:Uncharacterized protein n=1 Tax=Trichonephila clavipes TaxID=2585209 RepID=A0A8X7B8F7_TRICX|nr:hypothetical protein TNCV_3940961 [Trichonephila clavipes]